MYMCTKDNVFASSGGKICIQHNAMPNNEASKHLRDKVVRPALAESEKDYKLK